MAKLISQDALEERLDLWHKDAAENENFNGKLVDLERWLKVIETGCLNRDIPKAQWADAGMSFLTLEELKSGMKEWRASIETEFWSWEDFKHTLEKILAGLEATRSDESDPFNAASAAMARFRADHPFIAATAGAGLVVAGSTVLLPAAGLVALNAVGFTAGGVVGGSVAAGVQSVVYGAFTGGLFSVCQSFAATTAIASAGSVVAATTSVGIGARSLWRQAAGSGPSA